LVIIIFIFVIMPASFTGFDDLDVLRFAIESKLKISKMSKGNLLTISAILLITFAYRIKENPEHI